MLFALVSNRWTVRPLLTVLVIATAFAVYYMRTYAVILDPTMLRNVVRTDVHESRELLSVALFGRVFAWSALPVALIWWVDLHHTPLWRAATFRAAALVAGLLVGALALLPISRDMTSVMRNQKELRYLITPGNYIYSLARNAVRDARGAALPRVALGSDARSLLPADPQRRPRVFVLVLGETARAANFSLFGYPRETNPELAKLDIVAFSHVTACGTSTEISVPCMFSRQGRADYDEQRIRHSEGVLQVLARAGHDVRWLDNQSGCKGVCDGPGITYRKLDAAYAPDLCRGEDCVDEILIRALGEQLADLTHDTVYVLHTIGNHGPAYYRRYPDAFRRFVPDCRTAELRDCSREEVVNAYDNAILYTDHVVASAIGTLRAAAAKVDSALLYVSDHGESLGEGGFYLHGLPWSIAPQMQTHVPLVAWSLGGLHRGRPPRPGLPEDACCRAAVARQPVRLDAGRDGRAGLGLPCRPRPVFALQGQERGGANAPQVSRKSTISRCASVSRSRGVTSACASVCRQGRESSSTWARPRARAAAVRAPGSVGTASAPSPPSRAARDRRASSRSR